MDARWRAPRPSGVYIQPASDPNSGTRRQWQAAIWVGPRLGSGNSRRRERAAPSASSRRPERDSKGFTWDPLREGLSSDRKSVV